MECGPLTRYFNPFSPTDRQRGVSEERIIQYVQYWGTVAVLGGNAKLYAQVKSALQEAWRLLLFRRPCQLSQGKLETNDLDRLVLDSGWGWRTWHFESPYLIRLSSRLTFSSERKKKAFGFVNAVPLQTSGGPKKHTSFYCAQLAPYIKRTNMDRGCLAQTTAWRRMRYSQQLHGLSSPEPCIRQSALTFFLCTHRRRRKKKNSRWKGWLIEVSKGCSDLIITRTRQASHRATKPQVLRLEP